MATRPDAHEQPPQSLRVLFKQWQKCPLELINSSPEVLDTASLNGDDRVQTHDINEHSLQSMLESAQKFSQTETQLSAIQTASYFEVTALPGGQQI